MFLAQPVIQANEKYEFLGVNNYKPDGVSLRGERKGNALHLKRCKYSPPRWEHEFPNPIDKTTI